jgi:diguanylate cyclase (GGDEF)-like protein/PAS domain S-box-containing protein
MLLMHYLEHFVRRPLPAVPADASTPLAERWPAAQVAAVAAAEAIAATAAADVAHDAAITAQTAVDVACAAAVKAAVKAAEVAADAVLASAEAAAETQRQQSQVVPATVADTGTGTDLVPSPTRSRRSGTPQPEVAADVHRDMAVVAAAAAAAATAAATVAVSVASVAEAAARAVETAASLIGEQLAKDVAATAQAVTAATEAGPASLAVARQSRRVAAGARALDSDVTRVLRMRAQGASPHTIAATLNAEGSLTIRGRRWSAQSVVQIHRPPSVSRAALPGVGSSSAGPARATSPLEVLTAVAAPRGPADVGDAERRLAEAERLGRFGTFSWTVATDEVTWSDELYRMFGVEDLDYEATYAGSLQRVHLEDQERVAEAIASVFAGATSYEFDYRAIHPNGTLLWLHVRGEAVRDDDGKPVRLFGTVIDKTAAKMAEQRDRQQSLDLARLASHDSLTGLANRGLLQDRLEHALARRGQVASVMVLDLDDFKAVNDAAGHAGGDRFLVEVASRLLTCVRGADTVARLSGDEFAVIVEDGTPLIVAERILAAFSVPVVVGGRQVTPSASIGIATSDSLTSSNELLMQADVAMYAAKAAGKGRMATFDAAMGNALRMRADLHDALRDAVCSGEIVVHYQPIFDVRTQSLSRVEALVRWQRPEGLLAPIEFLPLAEDTGLIVGIGQEVLRQTCEQMRGWLNEDASRSVSVNVSALQLAETNYAERVLSTLAAADVEPSQFSLEVTETLFLDPTPGLISRLDTLRSFGIRVSIDDFGTGYSSLGRLHTLPIDSIKIDKSFVDLIQEGDEALPIITSIVVMAHALGLDATAEGVETPHQAARLTALGCDYLQGYHFGRPVPAAPEGA